jgi:hypothetical protein
MLVKELKGPLTIDAVATLKELDLDSIRNTELSVQPTNLGELVRHPTISSNSIVVPSLDHEWAGRHQVGHLGVVECMA